jgi:hypothetical protein
MPPTTISTTAMPATTAMATTAMSAALRQSTASADDQGQRDDPKTFGKFQHRRTSNGTPPKPNLSNHFKR